VKSRAAVALALALAACSSSTPRPDAATDATGGHDPVVADAADSGGADAADLGQPDADAAQATDTAPADVPADVTSDVPGDGATDGGADATGDAGLAGSFGQPCQVDQPTSCQSGLFCLQGPNGGNNGFCSKTCPPNSGAACPGAPAGTAAYCVVTDVDLQGDKGCAFVCKEGTETYTCPGTLTCQTTEDPPGSGQYLCLP
jgi:hypothetical protein